MTRATTLAGYAVILAAAVAYQLAGVRRRRTATLGEALAQATALWPVRLVLLAGWLWLGWHVFVRADLG